MRCKSLYGAVGGLILLAGSISYSSLASQQESRQLLNVSYDPTRELYTQYNEVFKEHWKKTQGETISFALSNGGSGKQARAVLAGLDADVVTLALDYDIDKLAEEGLVDSDWKKELPNGSAPYVSPIVFLVRKGNPKQIHNWDDLVKPGIGVITPNPKTSGGARWDYLAAWGYADNAYHGDTKMVMAYMQELFRHVVLLDSGARAATTSFIERHQGDVLITWENEAFLAQRDRPDEVEIVVPSISIMAEPTVAVVKRVTERKENTRVAKEYLRYLYSPEGQRVIADNFYRPVNKDILQEFAYRFKSLRTLTIRDFGGWQKAQHMHFDDGGSFDQVYQTLIQKGK